MPRYIIAIDQGTTSSRAILFDENRRAVGSAHREIRQHFPRPGEVEHDAEEILSSVIETTREVIGKVAGSPFDVAAIGITNQRETCVVWEKASGKPIHHAIVWQDRRTASECERLIREGHGASVEARTGLLLDPYFSATKIAWVLDNVPGARAAAERGEILFGTIDSWLIWKLTGGSVHATDATNASRTSLYNIAENCWDEDLLKLFRVPRAVLPEVRDSAGFFGNTIPAAFGSSIAIAGVAGDQQAATIGQACLRPGMIKATFGTGCFVVLNTGETIVRSSNRMLSTIAYRIAGRTTYALEGSIFVAGAAVQWLRDSLKMIGKAHEAGELAAIANDDEEVYLVPAFVGLGAPYWNPDARGAIFGLTRASGVAEIARATLESVCFQSRDLLTAMANDFHGLSELPKLRVDGGMSSSDWAMQALANCLGKPVERPSMKETTAFGAALLAGSGSGIWPNLEASAAPWQPDTVFGPALQGDRHEQRYRRWKSAVESTLSFAASSGVQH
ncbi:glycerol kinase GlpK [Ochrobactrum sp. RH2CCR150]|uniref:glycerol kinase GlpK n=1 Tax=Ochrobactrum sp. RH2CCR150 TaxID=2587044 RepID=UPI0015FCA676|nr:glycerol kinase [Ochrobactrum sp. RH2CCR150]